MGKNDSQHEHQGAQYLNTKEALFYVRKHLNILVQFALIALVITALLVDRQPNNTDDTVASTATEINQEQSSVILDELSAAELAASIAVSSDNLVQQDVIAKAETIGAQESIASTSEDFISKPAAATAVGTGRDEVIIHKVAKGESLDDIAGKYGLQTETIRWANNLVGNNLTVGKSLKIPPIDGVLYTVEDGDTAESIARKFSGDADRIIAFNDAEIAGLIVGEEIVIPDGKPATSGAQNAVVTATSIGSQTSDFGSLGGGCAPDAKQSLGPVSSGDVIGFMGSTGSSTGKHLHLGLCEDGNYIDPVANRNSREMVAGFSWPVKNKKAKVSRWFDCSRYWAAARGNCPAGYYFHAGVDIAEPYGSETPILAIGDGEIIYKGYQYGGGFTVMIQHDNSLVSVYRHMLPF